MIIPVACLTLLSAPWPLSSLDFDWTRLARDLHSLVERPFKGSYFAPGQLAVVYKNTAFPRQISEGLLVTTAGFAPLI